MKCKLVTQELKAYNGFQWELGKKEVIETTSGELCSDQFFHYYDHPLLAILLNPIHASINNPRLFLVETAGESLSDKGLKSGSKELTLIEEIELPDITLNQKIAFGILCALEVNQNPEFVLWANNWLSSIDRSIEAAADAANDAAYAAAAANAAYYARAAYSAAYAAYSAVDIALRVAAAAAYAANAAAANTANDAANDAAAAAAYAANAAAANAANAAAANAANAADIDLISLAKKSLTYN
jgi:hypothetical protein